MSAPLSTKAFILLDLASPQSYPLLGLLPYPAPILHQIVGVLVSLVTAALIAVLARSGHLAHLIFVASDSMATAATAVGLGALALLPTASALTDQPRSSPRKPLRRAAAGSRSAAAAASVDAAPATRLAGLKKSSNGQASSHAPAKRHHPGLRNTGNTCFFNSTVQSLSSLPALRQHLARMVQAAEVWDVPTPATDALLELIDALNTPDSRASAINPTALVNALRTLPSSPLRSLVSAHQQQDAHELFVLLSDAIEKEMLAVAREADEKKAEQHAGLRGLIAPSLPWTGKGIYADPRLSQAHGGQNGTLAAAGSEHSLPAPFAPSPSFTALASRGDDETIPPQVSPFNALLAQRTTCLDCGYLEAIRHFSTEEISLSLPPRNQATRTSRLTGTSACSLEECLAMWCELEPVEWICWHCSLVRTRKKAKMEVLRLEASQPTAAPNGSASASASELAKPSVAKKKRLREARAREARLARVIASGLSEDELAALSNEAESSSGSTSEQPPLANILNGIKLDKQISRMSTKQVMLSRPPRALVLHLNRSSFYGGGGWGGASKNDRAVIFPDILDLTPFCIGSGFATDGRRGMSIEPDSAVAPVASARQAPDGTARTRPRLYRLCSITVHYGGHSFGHYVSYRRLPSRMTAASSDGSSDDDLASDDRRRRRRGRAATAEEAGEWVRISDETVRRCEQDEVLAQNPYMLFYEALGDEEVDELEAGRVEEAALTAMLQGGAAPTQPQPQLREKRERQTSFTRPPRPRIVHRWSTASAASTPAVSAAASRAGSVIPEESSPAPIVG